MDGLSLDLYDEARRAKIEALQWTLGRGTERPPIERDAVVRWFEVFQVPTPEEMALYDAPLIAYP
jgi:hypothetical protein